MALPMYQTPFLEIPQHHEHRRLFISSLFIFVIAAVLGSVYAWDSLRPSAAPLQPMAVTPPAPDENAVMMQQAIQAARAIPPSSSAEMSAAIKAARKIPPADSRQVQAAVTASKKSSQ